MARSVTSMAAGRSNRRYVVLAVVLALLSAVLVYATLSRAGGESGSGAGEVQTVVVAIRQGMTTQAADGIRRAAKGQTTLEEVFSVLGLAEMPRAGWGK